MSKALDGCFLRTSIFETGMTSNVHLTGQTHAKAAWTSANKLHQTYLAPCITSSQALPDLAVLSATAHWPLRCGSRNKCKQVLQTSALQDTMTPDNPLLSAEAR